MSYTSISTCARDAAFGDRVRAATIQEAWNNPAHAGTDYGQAVQVSTFNADRMIWPTAIASDVAAAYDSALAAGNPNPGGDPAVITDGMILANVQAKWPQDVAP